MALGSKQMASVALTAAQVAATIGGITAPGMFSVQIVGTLTATITFELTIDGTNWVAVELHPTTDLANTALTTTAAAAGVWVSHIATIASGFRARCSAFTSATDATIRVMYAPC
jgi:hypothetical protein